MQNVEPVNPDAMTTSCTQNAPDARGKRTGTWQKVRYKGSDFYLSPRECRVFFHLVSAGKSSTLELAQALNLTDPRSTIRDLRKAGIAVGDVWCTTTDGVRYKRYFVRKEVGDE